MLEQPKPRSYVESDQSGYAVYLPLPVSITQEQVKWLKWRLEQDLGIKHASQLYVHFDGKICVKYMKKLTDASYTPVTPAQLHDALCELVREFDLPVDLPPPSTDAEKIQQPAKHIEIVLRKQRRHYGHMLRTIITNFWQGSFSPASLSPEQPAMDEDKKHAQDLQRLSDLALRIQPYHQLLYHAIYHAEAAFKAENAELDALREVDSFFIPSFFNDLASFRINDCVAQAHFVDGLAHIEIQIDGHCILVVNVPQKTNGLCLPDSFRQICISHTKKGLTFDKQSSQFFGLDDDEYCRCSIRVTRRERERVNNRL